MLEVKKYLVEVYDFEIIVIGLEEFREFTPINKEKRKMSTCNRLDLKILH